MSLGWIAQKWRCGLAYLLTLAQDFSHLEKHPRPEERLTSTTRRMSLTATRMRLKQERGKQSWKTPFSEQKDRPIRCRASMTGAGRRQNQRGTVPLPAVHSEFFLRYALSFLPRSPWTGGIRSFRGHCPYKCPNFFGGIMRIPK